MPSDFTQLDAWKLAIEFCKEIYKILPQFPKCEESNIISQLRRASTSISTNIAEGCGKSKIRDEMSYFRVAQGSTKECMSLLMLSRELEYLNKEVAEELIKKAERVSKVLTLLIRAKQARFEEIKKKFPENSFWRTKYPRF